MSEVKCPRCKHSLTLPRQQGVRKIRCQACGEVFVHKTPAPAIEDLVLDWLNEDQPRDEDADDLVGQVHASVAGVTRTNTTGRTTK